MPRPKLSDACTFPGCAGKYYSKGYCVKHYQRIRAHGDPTVCLATPVPAAQRFASSFRVVGECWIWCGTINDQGYGVLTVGSKSDKSNRKVLAHRFSFELHNGPLPHGMNACHRCDTPACVNPGHLFAGTQADNVADMVAKGRNQKGSQNGQAKIDEVIAAQILTAVNNGSTRASVARDFGVARSLVSLIAAGKRWAHVHV
nr:HNH endonuclease signature motif containing protein [Burkholderia multivorans]